MSVAANKTFFMSITGDKIKNMFFFVLFLEMLMNKNTFSHSVFIF